MKRAFRGASALLLASALAAMLLGTAGCGGRDGATAKPSPTAASPTSTAPGTPAATTPKPAKTPLAKTPPGTGWTTGPVIGRSHVKVPPVPLLAGIRTGGHDGFDRIVFDFHRQIPGYDLRYVAKVIQDPSGQPANLPGRRFLVIRFEPLDAHDQVGKSTVPRGVKRTGLPMLRAHQIVGDFEAVVSVAIGLDDTVAYRVGVLTNPNRIYVDVAA